MNRRSARNWRLRLPLDRERTAPPPTGLMRRTAWRRRYRARADPRCGGGGMPAPLAWFYRNGARAGSWRRSTPLAGSPRNRQFRDNRGPCPSGWSVARRPVRTSRPGEEVDHAQHPDPASRRWPDRSVVVSGIMRRTILVATRVRWLAFPTTTATWRLRGGHRDRDRPHDAQRSAGDALAQEQPLPAAQSGSAIEIGQHQAGERTRRSSAR